MLNPEEIKIAMAKVIAASFEMSKRVHENIMSEIARDDMRFDAGCNGARYPDIQPGIIFAPQETHKDSMYIPKV